MDRKTGEEDGRKASENREESEHTGKTWERKCQRNREEIPSIGRKVNFLHKMKKQK